VPSEDIENLMRAVVIFNVCRSVNLLQLIVVGNKSDYQSKHRLQSLSRDNMHACMRTDCLYIGAVTVMTGLRAGRPANQGSIPGRDRSATPSLISSGMA
jgi:hypothetical protein